MLVSIKGDVRIFSYAAVGGAQEAKGPLGRAFDLIDESERFRQKTWEQSEGEMQRIALRKAMDKAGLFDGDVGHLFAGDLMNQCTSSSYGLMSFDIPHVGLYGACSTAAESISLASVMSDTTDSISAAVTSSHFCSAERQFRYPLEYGGQRTPTSQRTVTGSAAFLLGRGRGKIQVKQLMFGRSVDSKISDICNMGAAMAPDIGIIGPWRNAYELITTKIRRDRRYGIYNSWNQSKNAVETPRFRLSKKSPIGVAFLR